MTPPERRYRPTVRALAEDIRSEYGELGAPLVMRAYDRAAEHHRGEYRLNGAPYLAHCVAVALVIARVQRTPEVVAAALLHDVVDHDRPRDPQLVGGVRGAQRSPNSESLTDDEGPSPSVRARRVTAGL